MRVTILQDGTYNNASRRAVKCKAGDVLETSDAYANVLVADNLAEFVTEEEPTKPAAQDKKKRQAKRKTETPPASSKSRPNPFLS